MKSREWRADRQIFGCHPTEKEQRKKKEQERQRKAGCRGPESNRFVIIIVITAIIYSEC